ncbi:hypothetical protein [Glutamicibacter sp. BW77]|uniref:hypothetical protein n=1 Tax=Glutamicibacter sp. BW77 TaxID=2024402 RepID=UPI000BB82888|nr:hypothetical protein [Glutamicibacter sp. BW77]PCC37436.1 hypothetical protein CIK74_00515 [Glutamicibacter sp. BW77]
MTTNQAPLNTDAVTRASKAPMDWIDANGVNVNGATPAMVAQVALEAAAQRVPTIVDYAVATAKAVGVDPVMVADHQQSLHSEENAAHKIVNSVEVIPAKMRMHAWEGGEFEVGEIPEGHVLVGFEMVAGRAWSMADMVTIRTPGGARCLSPIG